MARRIAYASAVEGVLTLGDPQRRHLRLAADGVTYCCEGERFLPWSQVTELVVAAPQSRFRFPGAVRAAGAMLLAVTGTDDLPATADLEVRMTTPDGVETLACDGFLGSGYWTPRATALTALALVVSTDPETRAALDDPDRVLGAVADVARPGVTPGGAATAVRRALTAPS